MSYHCPICRTISRSSQVPRQGMLRCRACGRTYSTIAEPTVTLTDEGVAEERLLVGSASTLPPAPAPWSQPYRTTTIDGVANGSVSRTTVPWIASIAAFAAIAMLGMAVAIRLQTDGTAESVPYVLPLHAYAGTGKSDPPPHSVPGGDGDFNGPSTALPPTSRPEPATPAPTPPAGATSAAPTALPAAPPAPSPTTPTPAPSLPVPSPIPPDPAPAPGPPSPVPTAVAGPLLADIIQLDLKGCNREIYAATEIAANRVEEVRLSKSPQDWAKQLQTTFIDPTVQALRNYGRDDLASVVQLTLEADWLSAQPWLDSRRPVFAANLRKAPAGTVVEVELQVPSVAHQALLSPGQATTAATIVLNDGVPGVTRIGTNDDWQISISPKWNRDALANLPARTDIDIMVAIRYPADGSKQTVAHRATLFPVTDVQIRYPAFIGAFAHIDAGHPYLDEIAARITNGILAKKHHINLGATHDWREAFLWFREFQLMRVNYESSAMATTQKSADDPLQRIRPIHKTLAERSGNCADVTVLMASALSRTTEVFIMLPPGHAYIAYPDRSINRFVGIECTLLGQEDAVRKQGIQPQPLSPDQEAFRRGLSREDQRVFDLFILAMLVGTKELDEAVAVAQAGSQGVSPLAMLDSQRRSLEAAAAAERDPTRLAAIQAKLNEVATQEAWKHLRAVLIPLAQQLGAEHAIPNQATLQRSPLPKPPAKR